MAARKRRRDSSGHVDPFYQRRVRYEAALGALGLWEMFSAMPRFMQEAFWKSKAPDPVLEFDESVPDGREYRGMRRTVEQGFRAAKIEIDGRPVSVRDFLSVIVGCMLSLRHPLPAPARTPEPVKRFWRDARPRLEACYAEKFADVVKAMYYGVHVPLMTRSRLDTLLLGERLQFEPNPRGRIEPRVTIVAHKPQARKVSLEGKPREVYRVGTTSIEGDMRWTSWDPSILGRGNGAPELPVYVQGHALRQLQRRANLPSFEPYLHCWLEDSLAEPKIVRRQHGHLIVEQRLKEHRIGYLIVTPLKDMAVVRTFKFLTMEGLPEGRKLERRLRLTRLDAEYLGLHELAAFTQTDLRDDPELRRLMEECGCGHLFELAETGDDCAPQPKPFAAKMRQYLCMAA